MALLLAGLPDSVPGVTVNRLCGSGLEAVVHGARAIRDGSVDLVVAGGVESMSRAPYVLAKPDTAFARTPEIHDSTLGWRFVNRLLAERYGTDSMPETAENVAAEFGVSRADQDRFALRSQERAGKAVANGRLAREIMPVVVPARRGRPTVVDRDEHPRETSLAALAALGASATAGVPPRIMGLGPVAATRRLLARTGLTMADLDVVELNEAFAA